MYRFTLLIVPISAELPALVHVHVTRCKMRKLHIMHVHPAVVKATLTAVKKTLSSKYYFPLDVYVLVLYNLEEKVYTLFGQFQ